MPTPASTVWDAHRWAEATFARANLGDQRRSRRAVVTAARMMGNPSGTLPAQMGSPAATEGARDLLAVEAVSHAALLAPHRQQTHELAGQHPVVLFIQDTTQVVYTDFPSISGLGPIGDGQGQGFLLHTTLAVVPTPREVLGIAHQVPWLRQATAEGETRRQRWQRPRESQVWGQAVEAIGAPPSDVMWVEVGDRESDVFDFLDTCRRYHHDYLIRVAQNRCIEPTDEAAAAPSPPSASRLLDFARQLEAVASGRVFELSADERHPARTVYLALSYGTLMVQPPPRLSQLSPHPAWVIRVWEPTPPADVSEPVEWVLLTSVPTETVEQAWERAAWYACRWLDEDYHKCLKTGCRLEARRLSSGAKLMRLLGLLAPIALRLLQLRELARLEPDRLAHEVLPPDLLAVVAHLAQVPSATLRLHQFWWAVAKLGGYQGRRRDRPPGWQTIWRGWQQVQTLLEGVHLAARLPPTDT